jgi:putative cardiolipin synthase
MKLRVLAVILLLIVVAVVLLATIINLPDNSDRSVSRVIDNGASTGLGMAFAPLLEVHPGETAVHLLKDGLDAFVARGLLARQAERSIDVQYYMFHQDTVGRLLINELLDAADRGVRVRLLVDDMYGSDADDVWLSLDSHDNFEVRLFNPFVRGYSKNLQFVTQLKRVNHRMHSKSFTIDDQITIVGGRNIGDEYFNADPDLAFTDLDVMAIGPVTHDVSSQFDQYWNSSHAYPVTTLDAPVAAIPLEQLRKDMDAFFTQKHASDYVRALENSQFADQLKNHTAQFSFARAIVIHDSAEKLTKEEGWQDELLITQLAPYIKQAQKEFILVSPYFVPGRAGAEAICELANRGVRVRILTNSLVSNDVTAVHTGYMRHRKDLLRCGVELYELNEKLKKMEGKLFTWLPGLSKSSLHAKTMAVDGEGIFVGSFNFDPRSMNLNNEIGILFYEPVMASQSSENFDKYINKVAFRVELVEDDNGRETLRWTANEADRKVVFYDEPYAGFWQKTIAQLMRIIPADFML